MTQSQLAIAKSKMQRKEQLKKLTVVGQLKLK